MFQQMCLKLKRRFFSRYTFHQIEKQTSILFLMLLHFNTRTQRETVIYFSGIAVHWYSIKSILLSSFQFYSLWKINSLFILETSYQSCGSFISFQHSSGFDVSAIEHLQIEFESAAKFLVFFYYVYCTLTGIFIGCLNRVQ